MTDQQLEILTHQIESAETVMAQLKGDALAVRLVSYKIYGMITLANALGIITNEKRDEMEKDNDKYLCELMKEEKS